MLQALYLRPMGPWTGRYELGYRQLDVFRRNLLNRFPGEQALDRLSEPQRQEALQALSLFDEFRLARLCAYLRQRRPDDQVGYSILIYRLTDPDVEDALKGPSAELVESPYPP